MSRQANRAVILLDTRSSLQTILNKTARSQTLSCEVIYLLITGVCQFLENHNKLQSFLLRSCHKELSWQRFDGITATVIGVEQSSQVQGKENKMKKRVIEYPIIFYKILDCGLNRIS